MPNHASSSKDPTALGSGERLQHRLLGPLLIAPIAIEPRRFLHRSWRLSELIMDHVSPGPGPMGRKRCAMTTPPGWTSRLKRRDAM